MQIFLITEPSLLNLVNKYIPKGVKTIIPSVTITNSQYDQIISIPKGATVMVVNDCYKTAIDTIVLLHNLEIDHLNYIPYYPNIKNIPNIDIAITPGESQYVPTCVKQIFDIGHRVIDADTLAEIAISLNLKHVLDEDHIVRYLQNIKTVKDSLISLFNKKMYWKAGCLA